MICGIMLTDFSMATFEGDSKHWLDAESCLFASLLSYSYAGAIPIFSSAKFFVRVDCKHKGFTQQYIVLSFISN